jgi:hypothetical protein
MRWARHVAHGRKNSTYRVLVGKPERERPLRRHRHRWEDNLKMDIKETGCNNQIYWTL